MTMLDMLWFFGGMFVGMAVTDRITARMVRELRAQRDRAWSDYDSLASHLGEPTQEKGGRE